MTQEEQQDLEEKQQDQQPEEPIEKSLEEQCNEYKAGWQRAQADYQNLKKQVDEQRSEWAKMSAMHVIQDFIPVLDNFKKAFATPIESGDKQWENWKKGIEYIMKQYEKVLEDHGVTTIKTIGETFDPTLHEAVGEEESDKETGTILKEIDAGYKLSNKILKVAKVIISK